MTGLQNGHNPARGEYDYRGFARALKRKYYETLTPMRPLSVTIGVTVSDLSRAMGGQIVSVGKVIALCRWLDVPVDHFYIEPEIDGESTCFTGSNVKHGSSEVRS